MLMMGAGELAPHLIKAHASIRPIRQVLIWNRSPEKAKVLAARLNRPGFKVEAVSDPAEAAFRADLVSCATYAAQPILKGEWLKAGTHVDLVGSYRPDLREADDDVVRRAGRIFVDERSSTVGVSGDVIEPLDKGLSSGWKTSPTFSNWRRDASPGGGRKARSRSSSQAAAGTKTLPPRFS